MSIDFGRYARTHAVRGFSSFSGLSLYFSSIAFVSVLISSLKNSGSRTKAFESQLIIRFCRIGSMFMKSMRIRQIF